MALPPFSLRTTLLNRKYFNARLSKEPHIALFAVNCDTCLRLNCFRGAPMIREASVFLRLITIFSRDSIQWIKSDPKSDQTNTFKKALLFCLQLQFDLCGHFSSYQVVQGLICGEYRRDFLNARKCHLLKFAPHSVIPPYALLNLFEHCNWTM